MGIEVRAGPDDGVPIEAGKNTLIINIIIIIITFF